MAPPGKSWNGLGLSEDPLVDLLTRLGWTYDGGREHDRDDEGDGDREGRGRRRW